MHLTRRESQLCELIHQELANKEIGGILGITEGTVKTYVTRLKTKLGTRTRVGIALHWERRIAQPHVIRVA